MTTTADLIHETESHLLSGDRDELNQLKNDVDSSTTTIPLTFDVNGAQQGAYVCIDLEVMYVWSVNENTKSCTVQRAMMGSLPAAHSGGAVVYVNPKFSKFSIFRQLNVALADISPELFQVKEFSLTTQPVKMTYPIPAQNTDLLRILEIRWQPPGAEKPWVRVRRDVYSLLRDMPDASVDGGFASGMGLRLDYAPGIPGRPMTVRYTAPFTPLAALTDDVPTQTGLPLSSCDIPPLGAAMRLMGVREAKRSFLESTMDTRRASEVPSGAAARSAQMLMQLYRDRIKSEVEALREQWPEVR